MTNTVFVSGGSGYIAGFLIRQLVAEGWMVHTTVRSLAREHGAPCYVSLEGEMACGYGVCLGCAVAAAPGGVARGPPGGGRRSPSPGGAGGRRRETWTCWP